MMANDAIYVSILILFSEILLDSMIGSDSFMVEFLEVSIYGCVFYNQ